MKTATRLLFRPGTTVLLWYFYNGLKNISDAALVIILVYSTILSFELGLRDSKKYSFLTNATIYFILAFVFFCVECFFTIEIINAVSDFWK